MLLAKAISTESQLSLQTETMKLIGNSSSGYQKTDCSRHTKHGKGFQLDNFINNRFSKSLNELPDQIYEIKMNKTFLFYLYYARQAYNVAA